MEFLQVNSKLIAKDAIISVDYALLNEQVILVHHKDGYDAVTGFAAIELLWTLKPSVLEGKWFHWRKHVWAIHNLVAHPLMQILAWLRLYKAAIWIHDITVPEPTYKNDKP